MKIYGQITLLPLSGNADIFHSEAAMVENWNENPGFARYLTSGVMITMWFTFFYISWQRKDEPNTQLHLVLFISLVSTLVASKCCPNG